MKKEFHIENIADLKIAARELLENTSDQTIWAFYGEMGAGKTTFIKEICQALQVKEQVASPTFNLINEYEAANGKLIYHFDFYRLNELEEAMNIGTLEYFESGELCLLEWPEKVEPILPEKIRNIYIRIIDKDQRKIKITDNE
ncbi:ADP-binding protein [Salinivirga cyanobacteriivorans]|uniref:tRNA threonylcarbamoyladenosine biosynthesis protein TsaE n=1 Tax=Salinivirga cyanobacteriivorans TaxID=1307839 RepID=A0A0S2HZU6_9BACT|nr:tRNA (adenosine(37)-N6)-threonylcarbamoyltransferase complex ATPase subunit type 1 TsaE [Salinivirga cyanobacteriivorans]ALO15558.1 ADP-binding protein [Salinivirga cyanobacteriivorans]